MRFNLVENISRKNDVLSIAVSPTLRLGAAVWTAKCMELLSKTRTQCLEHALYQLQQHFPGWSCWLVAASRTWQPDNRITRYNGFWKSLDKAGVLLPSESRQESIQTTAEGIRFFGACRFAPGAADHVAQILEEFSGGIIAADVQRGDEMVRRLLHKGWAMNNTRPPEEILETVCRQGALVVSTYGEFDDIDVSAAIIGTKEIILSKDW